MGRSAVLRDRPRLVGLAGIRLVAFTPMTPPTRDALRRVDPDCPPRFQQWAFEWKLGYRKGYDHKAYAWSPALGTESHYERKRAYDAGRAAGRRARAKREENSQ
jgi:hypothetical protein